MAIKQSESVFDPIELEGLWWIPALGKDAPKYPGVLRYKVGEERELKLWGNLDAFFNTEKNGSGVICGECPGNKFVTLFGCGVSSRRTSNHMGIPGVPIARIRFLEMWVGRQPYSCNKDVCFQEFKFGINNLEQWRNAASFAYDATGDGFERIELSYTRPEPILLYEDDYATVKIVYDVGPLNSSMGQKFFTVEHAARVQIIAKNGELPFYGTGNSICYYQDIIFQFFTLLIGGFTFTYNYAGMSYDIGVPETEAEYYQARSLSKEQTSDVIESEMFLPYERISETLQEMFKNFIANWKEFGPYIPLFTAFRNHVFSWTFHTLPELLYTFEGLERALYGNNKIYLEKRFDEVYSKIDIPKIFPYLGKPHWNVLTSYLKNNIRNAHAHGRVELYHPLCPDHELDYNCCRWMTLLMTAMVFHTCGLSPEEIHNSFISNARGGYNWIKAVFDKTLFKQTSVK